MSDHSISVIDKLMKNVVARLLYLRECAEGDSALMEQIDAAIQESSTVSHKHEVEVAHLVNMVDEIRGQRDAALDELEKEYAFRDDLERGFDDLLTSIEDLRKHAEHPEVLVARHVQYELDLDYEDAVIAVELLTGRTDVYLSTYTRDDVREQLMNAIEEVKESRQELEEEGGAAE